MAISAPYCPVRNRIISLSASLAQPINLIRGYRNLLMDILSEEGEEYRVKQLKLMIKSLASDLVGLVISCPVITDIAQQVALFLNDNEVKRITRYILKEIKPKSFSFNEQIIRVSLHLANVYEKEKRWHKVAATLTKLNLQFDIEFKDYEIKFEIFIRISYAYCILKNQLMSKKYIDLAALLQHKNKNPTLNLIFLKCHANILDLCSKFLEAANKYNEVSLLPNISEEGNVRAKTNTILCAILAPDDIQRNQLLASLCQDKRFHSITGFSIIKYMNLCRIVPSKELPQLRLMKSIYHNEKIFDLTRWEQVVMEYNILKISKLFNNAMFSDLGILLNIEPIKVMRILEVMIDKGRLEAYINRADEIVLFNTAVE